MDARTYEKLCEHGTFYESYTYSKQPKTPKPTNIEKKKAKKSTIIEQQTCFFLHIQELKPMMPPKKL